MSEKFQKPFIPQPGILNSEPGDPLGFVSKDGEWAAIPCGKKFIIVHKGQQVHTVNNYQAAKTYITKQIKTIKKKSSSSLEKFL